MRMGDTLLDRAPQAMMEQSKDNGCLRDSVASAVSSYLEQLDGQLGTEVYQMVLTEVEGPLLEQVMQYTRNNQTKASRMLGLNRGTLRKKLKQHGLLDSSDA
jgi:Fis family transcriptional regulator, factor for inversion stimulation protein